MLILNSPTAAISWRFIERRVRLFSKSFLGFESPFRGALRYLPPPPVLYNYVYVVSASVGNDTVRYAARYEYLSYTTRVPLFGLILILAVGHCWWSS